MPWWGWIGLGCVLLAAELAVQTEFWLAIIGAAALALGAGLLCGLAIPAWLQLLCFSALSILLAVTLRRGLVDWLARRGVGLDPTLVGEAGTSTSQIPPGEIGAVEVRGSTWRARNVGEQTLEAGDSLSVAAVNGLRLDVRR